MPLSGLSANLPTDVLLNPGVVYIGATAIGVTRGGVTFDPGHEFENIDWDGKQTDVYLHDRKFYGNPKLTFTMIEFADASTGGQILKLDVSSSAATVTATGNDVTTITPANGGNFLASGGYQSNLRVIWDRGAGTGTKRYLAILFAKALIVKYQIAGGETRREAEIAVEVEARLNTSSSPGSPAYVIEKREALPAS